MRSCCTGPHECGHYEPGTGGEVMLRVYGSRFQNCDGITRRNFLEIGASALGLSLADVFRLRAAASAENPGRGKSNKALIVFWTHGGLSQQDTYDMKPDAPPEF